MSQVSYEELTFAANLIQSRTFLSFEVYLVTTGIYLALSIAMRQLLMAAGRKWLQPFTPRRHQQLAHRYR